MTSVDNAPWRPTPINGHPGGRLPDSFLAEHPRAQYDHTVADFTRRYDDPCVAKFRAELEATNGIPGLELVEPHQVERAAELFARDGFVGALSMCSLDSPVESQSAEFADLTFGCSGPERAQPGATGYH